MKSVLFILPLVLSFLIFSGYKESFGLDQILITISNDRDAITYDGKWTDTYEWKRTSLDTIPYDDGRLVILRTAHQGNFLYVFVDAINDFTLDNGKDNAVVCIDGNNTKSELTDKNDFCFTATLGQNSGAVLQGGDNSSAAKNFQNIINATDFIGTSSVSDQNDRYTTTKHPSYEFRMPIELFGRSDKYGFFLSAYDASAKKFYNWPTNVARADLSSIPPPLYWGELVSPDKSLPEFNTPVVVFVSSIIIIIYLARAQHGKKFFDS